MENSSTWQVSSDAHPSLPASRAQIPIRRGAHTACRVYDSETSHADGMSASMVE
ncbi:MAG: hypothetical protein ACOYYI_02145 [Chloroflexota bacterium]